VAADTACLMLVWQRGHVEQTSGVLPPLHWQPWPVHSCQQFMTTRAALLLSLQRDYLVLTRAAADLLTERLRRPIKPCSETP